MNKFIAMFKTTELEKKILGWRQHYLKNKLNYMGSTLWQDIGQHPLDILFQELASLYVLANVKEKKALEVFFSRNDHRLWQLIIFIRRVAKLVVSEKDEHLIRLGLTIAVIEGARFDYRDSIVSLLILRYAAEKADIPIKSMFAEYLGKPIPQTLRNVFVNVVNHPEEDILYTVRKSGPPDWLENL